MMRGKPSSICDKDNASSGVMPPSATRGDDRADRAGEVARLAHGGQIELDGLATPDAKDAAETKPHRDRVAVERHLDRLLRQRLGLRVEQQRRRPRAGAERSLGRPAGLPE